MPSTESENAPPGSPKRGYSFFTKTVVLTTEDRDRFEAFTQEYFNRFQPIDEPEISQVEKLVYATWRQRRLWTIERTLLEIEMHNFDPGYPLEVSPSDLRLAKAFLGNSSIQDALDRLAKLETNFDRMAARADRTLRLLQQNRRNEPEPEPANTQQPVESQNEANEPTPEPSLRAEEIENEANEPELPIPRFQTLTLKW